LYTVPITGGGARRITSGLSFDGQPRYSPDGKSVVFVSDRSGGENLWLADADGSNPRALTRGDDNQYISPEWTPDGDYIVSSRAQGTGSSRYDLYLYHKDGGSGVQITRAPTGGGQGGPPAAAQMNALGAAFGPDGRYIYFSRKNGGFGYNLMLPQWQIAIYDRQTGQYHTQTATYGSAMRPMLSPDGRWLVYASRNETETGFRLRDLQSGDERWLRTPVQRDDQESRFTRDLMPGSSFTPDSRFIVSAYHGKIWKIAVATGDATEIPFTARVDQDLGPRVHVASRITDGPITIRQIRGAVLSPDGRRIAFTALDRLWVADVPVDTAAKTPPRPPVRLTADSVGEHTPAWSPDGRSIAYASWHDSTGGHVYQAAADGRTRPVRLTTAPAYYLNPAYSPDGRRVVVVRGPRYQRINEEGGPGLELVWLPVTGGAATLISRVPRASMPHFVRGNDERLYYFEGDSGLVSFRYDGTDRRRHVRVTGFTPPGPNTQPQPAGEILMAPTGGRALAQMGQRVFLVTVPQVGAEPPTISVANPRTSSVPVRQVARTAGDFLGWSRDARTAHWSLGRFFFRYDVAMGDSIARVAARADTAQRDTTRGRAEGDSAQARRGPTYDGHRVEIQISAPRDVPQGSAVLRGARIITMRGDEVIADGDVVVTDNRITAVCSGRCPNPPAGARVIDAAGKTITPGWVDIHAHLRPPFGVHKGQVWEYLANLAYGVTTTRDPQTATTDVLSYGDMAETGQILGPRIFSTGPGVFVQEDLASLDQAKETLRRYAEYYQTGTIKEYMTGNRKQRQWVIMAARDLGLMPTTEGGLDFKMNLTEMLDGYPGHEHSWPITPLFGDVLRLGAASGIVYTP
ncbi:MAG: PD40 domain-containing protein, partial [Gemmatimonadetes bacterium]|nr:PD40 domain-containing protein [Gemmatimonadota bacterium]